MYTYRITNIDFAPKRLDVYFKVFKDGKRIAEDNVQIPSTEIMAQPIDGRVEFVQSMVINACKRHMAVEDVKTDFSSIVGNDYTLDGIVYETKAERQARILAEMPVDQNLENSGIPPGV